MKHSSKVFDVIMSFHESSKFVNSILLSNLFLIYTYLSHNITVLANLFVLSCFTFCLSLLHVL